MEHHFENWHSLDLDKLKKDEITTWFDLDKHMLVPGKIRIQDHLEILKSYFSNKEEYNKLFDWITESLHASVPESYKANCDYCNGVRNDAEGVKCVDYLNRAEDEYNLVSYVVVMSMINNEDFLHGKDVKRDLAIVFFENLSCNNGILNFDAVKFNGILLNTLIEIKKESFKEFESQEILLDHLNQNLYFLRDYKIKAKNLNHMISENLKPQIEFFKNELNHQLNKRKINLKPRNKKVSVTAEIEYEGLVSYFEYTNRYNKVLTLLISGNKIEQGTNIWIDNGNGHKGYCVSMIKNLHSKGYFTNNQKPSTEQIRAMCKLTFGLDLSKSLVDRAKPDSHNFDFIPVASTLATNL